MKKTFANNSKMVRWAKDVWGVKGWLRWTMLLVAGFGCGGAPASSPDSRRAPICVARDPGPARLRRLTRFEVGHVLADLLGLDAKMAKALADRLPPDEISLGYDNIAAAYGVSAAHVGKVLDMAEAAAELYVADGGSVTRLAGCDPFSGGDAAIACQRAFIVGFGERVWRRAIEVDEVAALMALNDSVSEGEPLVGLRAVVAALLQAPDFLYRPEPAAADATGPRLPTSALATRLAFLITNSAPDAELLAKASAVDSPLATTAGLAAETTRLLAKPRALESFQHFVEQWWELGELASVQKDTNLYRTWTAAIPAAFAEETRLFLASAWTQGPTLDRLLRGTTTFANVALADFYGYPLPSGSEFQPVAVSETRGSGLFTQGSFLATHAKPDQTSPVHRGRFVRAQLFCNPPPPPPPDLVVTPPSIDPRLSTRERFQQHTTSPPCASCHALMDPIGFAFEHYDATGRWRDADGGKPIDARGILSGTDVDAPLSGVPELAARVVKSAQVRMCVATQWFRWAFGRDQETEDDLCTIGALANALADAGGDLRVLVPTTVASPTFQNRRISTTIGDAP